MSSQPQKTPPPDSDQQEPGPTDVTLEEALDEMTTMYGNAAQQLAVAQIKLRKQQKLIGQLQDELVASTKKEGTN